MRVMHYARIMRTTVSIDDELLESARLRARQTGRTLGEVVEDALRRELSRQTDEHRVELPVFTRGTGPAPGLDLRSNASLYRVLDDAAELNSLR
jgi:Arc/MetJ family transcription regulator